MKLELFKTKILHLLSNLKTFILQNLLTSLFSGLHFGVFVVLVTLHFLIGQRKQSWIRVEQVGYKSHIQLGVS